MNRSSLYQLLLVGLGGFFGSALRYLVSGWGHRLFPQAFFPVGTLLVNGLGCLVMGFLGGLADQRQLFGPETRLFVLIGLLGGFTTFSTFAFETFALAQDAEYWKAIFNIVVQVVLGLVAAWAGYTVARQL